MASAVDNMVNAMIACIGIGETNGNNTNIITRWYGLNDAWCDMTITYSAYHSGNQGPVCFNQYHADTVEHAQAFRDRGQWHTDTAGIKRGDIVFFDWDGSNSISAIDHVGMVESVSGSNVNTIEGNISNVCKRMVRHSDFIAGYGRPAYPGSSTPTPPTIPTPPKAGTYTVVAGDTLSNIAFSLKVTLAALRTANPQITDPDSIEIGQILKVPGVVPKPPAVLPTVSYASVRAASSGGRADTAGTALVQKALAKLGFITFTARGSWDVATTTGYAKYQKSLGYTGSDASGHPGLVTLTALAKKTGLFIAAP